MIRTKNIDVEVIERSVPVLQILEGAIANPYTLIRELNNRSFHEFLKFFWCEYSSEEFKDNWHIKYICGELQIVAENLAQGKPKIHDLIINVPPGTSKTAICSIFFPAWCWTRWYWLRFICLSYSKDLSLESAEYSRELIRSERYKIIYPELHIKEDKDTKSNFRIQKKIYKTKGAPPRVASGGNRFSTSVEGTVTGFHGHFIIWDDPINPEQAVSPVQLENANRWMDQTLPTRKVDKANAVTIGIMQRLQQNDPTGHILERDKTSTKLVCLPGEIGGAVDGDYTSKVQPEALAKKYVDGMLDPVRLSLDVLKELRADLGQYGYAGQIGQFPTPPSGGMFKVDNFIVTEALPNPSAIFHIVRYWDKAATPGKVGKKVVIPYTVGVKMARLHTNKLIILDVKRGRWSTEQRERIILSTAEADGIRVKVYHEQEPGSGGKESAQATTRNLLGFTAQSDRPQGDKAYRADPYSVQVNDGNVMLYKADWNKEFIEEHRYFPHSTYKDQVDAAGGAQAKLALKKKARVLGNKR